MWLLIGNSSPRSSRRGRSNAVAVSSGRSSDVPVNPGTRDHHPVVYVEQLVGRTGRDRRGCSGADVVHQLGGLGGQVFVEAQVEDVLHAKIDECASAGEHDQHRRGEACDQSYAKR